MHTVLARMRSSNCLQLLLELHKVFCRSKEAPARLRCVIGPQEDSASALRLLLLQKLLQLLNHLKVWSCGWQQFICWPNRGCLFINLYAGVSVSCATDDEKYKYSINNCLLSKRNFLCCCESYEVFIVDNFGSSTPSSPFPRTTKIFRAVSR